MSYLGSSSGPSDHSYFIVPRELSPESGPAALVREQLAEAQQQLTRSISRLLPLPDYFHWPITPSHPRYYLSFRFGKWDAL